MGHPTVDILPEVRQLWDSPTSETLRQDVKGISYDHTLTLDNAKGDEDPRTARQGFAILTLALLQGTQIEATSRIQLQVCRFPRTTGKLT